MALWEQIFKPRSRKTPAAQTPAAADRYVRGFKVAVLVVEDDRDVLEAVCLALEELGVPLLRATDGQQALEVYEHEKPAVVVLDLMLPRRGGFHLLQRMRARLDPRDRRSPPQVIMITGNEGARHEEYALRNGARSYLRKPFTMQTLMDEVRAAFRDMGVEAGG